MKNAYLEKTHWVGLKELEKGGRNGGREGRLCRASAFEETPESEGDTFWTLKNQKKVTAGTIRGRVAEGEGKFTKVTPKVKPLGGGSTEYKNEMIAFRQMKYREKEEDAVNGVEDSADCVHLHK